MSIAPAIATRLSCYARLAVASLVLTTACQASHGEQEGLSKVGQAGDAALPSPSFLQARTRDGEVVSLPSVVKNVLPSVVSVGSERVVRRVGPGLPFGNPLFQFFFGPGREPPSQRSVQRGLGSGVIIRPGIVVTNHHVVANADTITVTASVDRQFDAEVVGSDPQTDVAVLRLKGDTKGLPVAKFGSASRARLGDVVLAMGNPFGVGETVTMGIVSAKGRADMGIEQYEDFIQTDAAINPGNSGGPLVDMDSEVIGINTAILSRTGGSVGIGFAIPSEMVKPIVESLLKTGKVSRGWLGVAVQALDENLARALDLKTTKGALVADVEPNSPAAKAGIERGDVIVSVGDKSVDSPAQLRNQIAFAKSNARLTITVIRDGKRRRISVQLAEAPSRQQVTSKPEPSVEQRPGARAGDLEAADLSARLRQRFSIPASINHGAVVTFVVPESKAARAGLRPGDVVLELNHRRVDGAKRLSELWNATKGDKLLLVDRGDRSLFIVIPG